MKPVDITGQAFGRLQALEPVGSNSHGQRMWRCSCECGKEHIAVAFKLRNGHTGSCGCLEQENRRTMSTSHGFARVKQKATEYEAYHNAKSRCTNPNNECFPDYGGRGIEFRFKAFEEFIQHIGLKPSPDLSLDRIDPDGHYEFGNVRWANASVQAHNKRKSKGATSRFRGVFRRGRKWRAVIAGQYLGRFNDEVAAAQAYDAAACTLFGDGARLNLAQERAAA